jgi:HAD superfamily hydrolase (TIGR01509 family)
MSQRRIGLVVFDLGRVMVRLVDGWRHACDLVGAPYPTAIDDDPAIRSAWLKLVYLNEIGQLPQEQYVAESAQLTGLTAAQATAVSDIWLQGPFEGYHELLDELHRKGMKTACLSNTNASHWAHMTEGAGPNRLPLDKLHFRFASHLIGAHKPEPAIYQHVEKTTGVTPRAILFFDDVALNCEAARQRGWAAQVIQREPDPVTQVRAALRGYGAL